MRNKLFWSLWCNVYCCEVVFGCYWYLCSQIFKYSEAWNLLIVFPMIIYILKYNVDTVNFIYRDSFSDIKIIKLKFRKWYNQWKKKK